LDNTLFNKCVGKSSVNAFIACTGQALIAVTEIDTDRRRAPGDLQTYERAARYSVRGFVERGNS